MGDDGGRKATFVVADVSDESAIRRVAEDAVTRFGRIDTWINGAGVSVYGRLMDISLEDQRRLFDTNFWGVVIGSRVAVPYLRNGGALINIGSVLSDRAIPLQGTYCASKHAVKGFTDSLRMELEHDRLPISVTLIKPYSIDTPYAEHAKNYLRHELARRLSLRRVPELHFGADLGAESLDRIELLLQRARKSRGQDEKLSSK